MTSTPTLTIHFGPPDDSEQVSLEVVLSGDTKPVRCSLTLPFRLAQIPLVLRALEARQYPDYPHYERLFRSNDDHRDIIAKLQKLGLWDKTARAVVVNVHVRVGQLLGVALLGSAAVRKGISRLYREAMQAGEGEIVLRFASGASALAALPWEVAHDDSRPILLARGMVLNCTRVIISDCLPPPSCLLDKRLRVLTISPRVQMNEVGSAFEELARARMRDELPVDIESLPQATMDALYKRLDQGPPVQVLDYFGHGISTDEGGALLLENAQGGRDIVPAGRLAALPHRPPLIVLHACQSAQVNINEPLTAIATTLSMAGVRAVLAMQLTIRMEAVANVVVPTFYRKLAEHKSVQQAVAAVRQALYAREPDGVSWYVPALYLYQSDQEPFVLMEAPAVLYPPNPFAGEGTLGDSTRFVDRAEVKSLWNRLDALGNLSIIGPAGSGKSAILASIATEGEKRLKPTPVIIWLSLQRKTKRIEAELMLARKLGGEKAKATDCSTLLEGKRVILLLDDLGQLDKGERGLDVRLWLRSLSQDRTRATVQLIATSMRPLHQIFKTDESPDYSPLHNVITDSIELQAFTDDEAEQYITKALKGTPFQLQDFSALLDRPLLPRALQAACRNRYDELCKRSYE